MNTLTRRLIAKEFFQHRWMIASSTLAGVASLLVSAGPGIRYAIGSLLFITAFVSFGVVLAMISIATERKERMLQFVLSLPVSYADYVRIKVWSLLACYAGPWLVMSGGAVALVLATSHLPDGLTPFVVLLSGFMIANFSLVLSGALLARTEGVIVLLIIVTNMFVSLFLFLVSSLPGIAAFKDGAVPHWNATFWAVLAVELAVLVASCLAPYFIAARRRDFV